MIYHIAIQGEWESQADSPTYAPDRYRMDGFIHCSDRHQLEGVADHNFHGRRDLVLLELMPTRLDPETRYEQGGEEKYPHIYGAINKDAINRTVRVSSGADGLFGGAFDGI